MRRSTPKLARKTPAPTASTPREPQVPGVLCPHCKSFHIRLSIEQMLYASDVKCGACGLTLKVDRSTCAKMMELLQDLHVATQNVEALRRQSR